MEKTDLRLRAKAILSEVSEKTLKEHSQKISEYLLKTIPEFISKQKIVIGGYSPIQKEPIWFSAFDKHQYEYACVHMNDDESLGFFKVELEDLDKGLPLSLPVNLRSEVASPDVVLVPGLAFTEDCKRLGRGKGCYDKFLKDFSGLKLGVFLEVQKFDEIAFDEHDQILDLIITESKIYRK